MIRLVEKNSIHEHFILLNIQHFGGLELEQFCTSISTLERGCFTTHSTKNMWLNTEPYQI